MGRMLVVGLDEPEIVDLKRRVEYPLICHALLPALRIEDGRLLAERASGPGMLAIDRVVFHGIFARTMIFSRRWRCGAGRACRARGACWTAASGCRVWRGRCGSRDSARCLARGRRGGRV